MQSVLLSTPPPPKKKSDRLFEKFLQIVETLMNACLVFKHYMHCLGFPYQNIEYNITFVDPQFFR